MILQKTQTEQKTPPKVSSASPDFNKRLLKLLGDLWSWEKQLVLDVYDSFTWIFLMCLNTETYMLWLYIEWHTDKRCLNDQRDRESASKEETKGWSKGQSTECPHPAAPALLRTRIELTVVCRAPDHLTADQHIVLHRHISYSLVSLVLHQCNMSEHSLLTLKCSATKDYRG